MSKEGNQTYPGKTRENSKILQLQQLSPKHHSDVSTMNSGVSDLIIVIVKIASLREYGDIFEDKTCNKRGDKLLKGEGSDILIKDDEIIKDQLRDQKKNLKERKLNVEKPFLSRKRSKKRSVQGLK